MALGRANPQSAPIPAWLGRSLALLCFLALVLGPRVAPAQVAQPSPEQVAEARALFEKGVAASDAGHWAEAADVFSRSLALVERPSTLFNLLLALHQQERYREGLAIGARYLALAKGEEPERRKRVETLLAEMRDAMGTLALKVDPPAAHVLIDGVAHQGDTSAILLMPGRHDIVIHANGYGSHEEAIAVERHVRTLMSVTLSSLAAPGSGQTPAVSSVTIDQAEINARLRLATLEQELARTRVALAGAGRTKPLVLVGVGVGLIIAGTLMTSKSDDTGVQAGGVIMAVAGGGVFLAGSIKSIVRRVKRSTYHRRIEKFESEISVLREQLELDVSPTLGGASASLTLHF